MANSNKENKIYWMNTRNLNKKIKHCSGRYRISVDKYKNYN